MATPDRNKLYSNAAETAGNMLIDAFETVKVFLEYHDKISMPEAILIMACALLSQRDLHYEEKCASTVPAGDDGNESERHWQAARDYGWLKMLVSVALPNLSDDEYREVHARMERLAGL